VTGELTPAGHAGYAAGQLPPWFAQTRGTTSVLHVEPAAEQFTHAAPPEPHAPLVKPSAHALPPVQQPAQFAGEQRARHWRPWQTWLPGVQSAHCAPLPPHALSCVPMTQVLPAQQPAQLPGPQAAAWQAPPWQTWPLPAQFTHWPPPAPHAVFWLPTAQTLPMQQPAQFAGPQAGAGVQMPALQVSFAPQPLHTSPPLPHAAGVVATTQLLPTQQPGQFAGPQVTGVWQVRSPAQMRPVVVQLVHAAPWRPHAVASLPVTHVVPWQQPPQFWGPHVGVPWQVPPPPGKDRHVWPDAVQLVHDWPATPHAVASVPERHLSPTQQPAQLVASHLPTPQVPVRGSHARPCDAQSTQAAPPVPHAKASSPERQVCCVPRTLQQPSRHVVALHVVTVRPHVF